MQFEVVLKPHIGTHQTKLGDVPVQHAQDMVFVVGQEVADALGNHQIMVGYAGHQTTTIEFLPHVRNLGPDAPLRICAEVQRLTGRPRTPNLPSKRATDPGQTTAPLDLDRPNASKPVLDLDN